MSFHVPEDCRMRSGPAASDASFGNNGAFGLRLHGIKGSPIAVCIASDGEGWDHVSVRVNGMDTPSWDVMCLIRSVFWDDSDTVVQFHPPADQYVNVHPNVLHLWRPQGYAIVLPPKELV